MKKHYETHVEDTDKLISVAGPVLDYKSWYEQYRKLMEEQAQRKYGLYTPTSEGDDDFPSISGMIARYSASGLTNEQMAANPVWVDKTGNGYDLQLKNFAWGGMSGVGGYEYNFLSSDWVADKVQLSEALSYKITIAYKKNSVQLFKYIRNESENTIKITLKVTGIEINGCTFRVYDNASTSHRQDYKKDGIYQINYTATEGSNRIYFYVLGGNMGQLDNPITIEQLPLYPGALVFDGVDDYGVCDNFPILTKEKGYTVVALRRWLSLYEDNKYYTLLVNSNQRDKGAFAFEEFNSRSKGTFNFGNYTAFSSVNLSMPFTYQTSTSYNGKAIAIGGLKEGVNLFQVCKIGSNYCSKAAIWEIVILDHDATEEELTKIKDYFVKTYPWLFPDQAWTVTGKTNEDEDRATIANITGNGNDLVLSNFGFAEGSGYGLYAYNFNSFDLRDNVVKPTDVKKDSFRIIGTGNSSNVLVLSNTSNSAVWKIRITGMKEGDSCIVGNANKSGDYIKIIKDGIYTFQKQYAATSINGIWYNSSQEVDVLVEQIPEYEGYLVTDGVDDRVQDSSFKLNKDWTLVGEWVFLNQKATNAGITKPFSFVVYNRTTGLSLFINTGTSGITIENVKSIKAICSDGRIYLDDWSEMLISKDQDITSSTSVLSIGFNGTAYTQMAFKNLGIYNNQILSKDDCIKAYNYLQTLKSK